MGKSLDVNSITAGELGAIDIITRAIGIHVNNARIFHAGCTALEHIISINGKLFFCLDE